MKNDSVEYMYVAADILFIEKYLFKYNPNLSLIRGRHSKNDLLIVDTSNNISRIK